MTKTYRSDIDGLRAISVIAVVLYHSGLGFPGGYVGVDVFFVISGYLITALILRDLRAEKFSLVEFWERRARRILPALTVCVAASLVVGWLILLPSDLEMLGRSALAQCLFAANIFFWRTTNYFGGENLEKPLLHTWSLAVEEQFYLLFPLALLLFRSLIVRRQSFLISFLLTCFTGSLLLSIWGVGNQPFATFFLLPTRAWELLCGALLAALPLKSSTPRTQMHEVVSWLGLGGIIIPMFCYSENTPFPGLAALPPCLGTAAVIWANQFEGRGGKVFRLLSLSPMRFVGLISYSLYLWHWPILAFANYWRTHELSLEIKWLLVAVSFGIAILSWKWIEQPFRRRQIFGSRRQIFGFAACSTVMLLGISTWLVVERGIPKRLPGEALAILEAAEERQQRRQAGGTAPAALNIQEIASKELPLLGVPAPKNPAKFLVWGDSHAKVALPAFDALGRGTSRQGMALIAYSTPPLIGVENRLKFGIPNFAEVSEAAVALVARERITDTFLIANWSLYEDAMRPGELEAAINRTIAKLTEAGTKVWILQDVPSHDVDVTKLVIRDIFPGWPGHFTSAGSVRSHFARNATLYKLASRPSPATFLDPAPLLLDSTRQSYKISQNRLPLYYDDNHLTAHGAAIAILPLLQKYVSGWRYKPE